MEAQGALGPAVSLHIVWYKCKDELKTEQRATSPAVQWLKLCLPVQGVQVQSLDRELRSHMLPGVAKD